MTERILEIVAAVVVVPGLAGGFFHDPGARRKVL